MRHFANYASVSIVGAVVPGMLLLAVPITLTAGEMLGVLLFGIILSSAFASFYWSWSRDRRDRTQHEVHEVEAREA